VESKIINTRIISLTFKFIVRHEIGMGGALVGDLFKIQNGIETQIHGIFGDKFIHSQTENKIALMIRSNENINELYLGIIDYNSMDLLIYTNIEHFTSFVNFINDCIICKKITHGLIIDKTLSSIFYRIDDLKLITTSKI
jgi:hypothetical protein